LPLGKRPRPAAHLLPDYRAEQRIRPAQVAEWARTSVPVPLATHVWCLFGQTRELQRRIDTAQDIYGPSSDAGEEPENFPAYSPQPPAQTR
jgi:hypothetical protein